MHDIILSLIYFIESYRAKTVFLDAGKLLSIINGMWGYYV